MTPYTQSECDAFGNWLAGFVDGEGHFRLSRCKRDRNFSCGFTINLRADDKSTLDEIRSFIGHGNVYEYPARGRSPNPMAHLNVSSRVGCATVSSIFTRYPLRSKKSVDFVIWKEAVSAWCAMTSIGRNGTTGQADWSNLERLWNEIRETRRFAA